MNLSRAGGRFEKTRPVLIVQNDVGNAVSSETIVLAIRDPHGGRQLPVFVPVEAGVAGMRKDSVIDAGHIYTVGKESLEGPIGSAPPGVMERVDRALRVSLAL